MMFGAIISRAESWQILKNDLRRAALEEHPAGLVQATAEERKKMVAQIERDIEAEVRSRRRRVEPGNVIQ